MSARIWARYWLQHVSWALPGALVMLAVAGTGCVAVGGCPKPARQALVKAPRHVRAAWHPNVLLARFVARRCMPCGYPAAQCSASSSSTHKLSCLSLTLAFPA